MLFKSSIASFIFCPVLSILESAFLNSLLLLNYVSLQFCQLLVHVLGTLILGGNMFIIGIPSWWLFYYYKMFPFSIEKKFLSLFRSDVSNSHWPQYNVVQLFYDIHGISFPILYFYLLIILKYTLFIMLLQLS